MSVDAEAVDGSASIRNRVALVPVEEISAVLPGVRPEYDAASRPEKWRKAANLTGRVTAGLLIAAGAVSPFISARSMGIDGLTQPVEVNPIDSLHATVRLHRSDQVDVPMEPFGAIHYPASLHVPTVGNMAPIINIHEVTIAHPSAETLNNFKALTSDAKDVSNTISSEIERNALIGIGVGGALPIGLAVTTEIGLAGYARIKRAARNQRKHRGITHPADSMHVYHAVLENNKDALPPSVAVAHEKFSADIAAAAEHKAKHRRMWQLRRVAAVMCLTAVGLAGYGHHQLEQADTYQPPTISQHIDPGLVKIAPDEYKSALQKVTVSGTGSWFGDRILRAGLSDMKSTDTYWRGVANDTARQFDALRASGKMAWEKDPNKVGTLTFSDAHGNRSFMKNALPSIIKSSGVNTIIDAGDQMNTGGTTIVDANNMQMLIDAVNPANLDGRQVQIAFISGNHDPLQLPKKILDTTYKNSAGQKYHPLIAIDKTNDYHINLNGLNIVGGPDGNRTTTGDTVPISPDAQYDNSAKLGQTLSDTACKLKQETNQSPVVLAHEREAAYQALANNCASLAISGHLHEIFKIKAYVSATNEIGHQEVVGSASGDGPNNVAAIYGKPTTEGQMMINVFDTTTGELTDADVIDYMPHGLVTVTPFTTAQLNAHPTLPTDNQHIQDFLAPRNLLPATPEEQLPSHLRLVGHH